MKTIYKKLLFLLLLLPFSMLAQSTLSGVVTDKMSGQPMPGVNVIIKGTTKGATTDFDGNYSLSNVKSGDVIDFSYVGFKPVEVVYTSQKNINVTLEEQAANLEEVVLVGYGTVKKKDATGSVVQVSTKDFNKGANVTAENLLNGRVAGVTINTGGAPGSGSAIRIRGGSSLGASNDPLIVIDGLPIGEVAGGSTSVLASINPNDIESFTVLKDASATAIYGSRASNGVIIITTKKGGKELAVDYNFQYGSGNVANKVDVFSSADYIEMVGENRPQFLNRLGVADPSNPGERIYYNTDWQDEIYRRTDLVENTLTVKGSLFKKIPTRLSVGNTYQEGLRLTSSFNRTSANLAINPTFFDNHLKINLNTNLSTEKNRFADGVEGGAIRFDPTQPVYDANSAYGGFFQYTDANGLALNGVNRNPVAALLQRDNRTKLNRIFGNFEVDYKFHFFEDLRAVVNLGWDVSDGSGANVLSIESPDGNRNLNQTSILTKGSYREFTSEKENTLLDAYLVYTKSVNNFKAEVTGGYSYQRFSGASFTSKDTRNTVTATNVDIYNTDTDVVLIGLFGRANFTFNDKYLLTMSIRRDGTSRFSEDNRWGNFPAAAFAWRVKDESFLKDSKVFSDLKLRAGWGITGQQNLLGSFTDYLATITTGQPGNGYVFGGQPITPGFPDYINPDLKWEETTTYNLGIDYGFWNNRITGALDFFYKVSDDLLAATPVPDGSNFSNQGNQNIGKFTSQGVEFAINAAIFQTDNFNWDVNFNATHFNTRIDKLAAGIDIEVGGVGSGTGGTIQVHSEGFTPFSFLVYKQLYDTAGAPIEGAYADINRDGIITAADRYIFKNPDPEAVLGFASNMNYKNFDFSFNLRASFGNRLYNAVNAGNAQYNNIESTQVAANLPTSVLDSNFNNTADVLFSDYYIENASFLRMDNITIGYTIPKIFNEKASLRLSGGVQNVFVITDYSGLDPEVFGGIDNTIYPRPRTILFGANVKF
jgi:TonB-dependent starch-binding outer membrane protein SusC